MSEFSIRSDNVDVEQIMRQIRARIREKRGVDYTEDEIRELASVKLERFLDPSKVRSGLIEEFRKRRQGPDDLENFEFEDTTIYASHRVPLLARIRGWLNPVLKLFFNPNPLIRALHLQSRLNRWFLQKEELDYELTSNLVLEITRLSIEVKNLKMRVESLSTRLDFDEHRARALEGAVQYRPDALAGVETPAADEGEDEAAEGEPARARRRRRRRGRRRGAPGGPADATPGSSPAPAGDAPAPAGHAPSRDDEPPTPDQ